MILVHVGVLTRLETSSYVSVQKVDVLDVSDSPARHNEAVEAREFCYKLDVASNSSGVLKV